MKLTKHFDLAEGRKLAISDLFGDWVSAWVPLVGTVLLAASAGAVTVHTAADGSTFDVTGGTLTITVPSGVTQSSYD